MQTLEGHAQNVSCASFHPELPIIITGSEDGKLEAAVDVLLMTHWIFKPSGGPALHWEASSSFHIMTRHLDLYSTEE